MGMVTTPDGQSVYVPDFLGFTAQGMGNPADVNPGAPVPPMGAGPVTPQPVPSATANLPPEVFGAIGLPGHQAQAQARQDLAPPAAPQPPVPDGPVIAQPSAKQIKVKQRANASVDRQARADAAYAASPEGRIEASTAGQQNVLAEQADIANAAGDVAAQEAEDVYAVKQQGLDNIAKQREARDKALAANQAKIDEHRALYNKAVDDRANAKIDEGRKWNDMGTGKKILAGISVALTAIGDALQGKSGPNMAIQMIQEAINDDVAAQVREREELGNTVTMRRNSLDDYIKETGSIQEAQNLKIAEEYKRVADQIDAAGAKYASPKARLAAADNAAKFRLMGEQLIGTSAEAKFARDQQREQTALAKSANARGWAQFKQGQMEFAANYERQGQQLALEAAKLEQAGNAAGAAEMRKLGGTAPVAIVKDAQGNAVLDENGVPQIDRGGVLKNDDGSVWTAPTEKEAIEMRDKQSKTTSIVAMLDEVRALRNKVGGETKLLNSDDSQRYQVLKNQIVMAAKAGTTGMSSDSDMGRLESSFGVDAVDSYFSQESKLDEARKQVINAFNTDMRFKGRYTGKPIKFDDFVNAPRPKDSAEDKTYRSVVSIPSSDFSSVVDNPEAAAAYSSGKLPAGVKQTIDSHVSIAAGGGQAGIRARKLLQDWSQDQNNPLVAKYAQSRLLDASMMPPTTEQVGPSTQTVRETVPPPRK